MDPEYIIMHYFFTFSRK